MKIILTDEPGFIKRSRLLSEGLFADSVILALYQFMKSRQLWDRERDTFEKARDFLGDVIEGRYVLENVLYSARGISEMDSLSPAIDKIKNKLSSDEGTFRVMEEMKRTVEEILANKVPTDKQLSLVDGFFSRFARIQYQRSTD